MSDAPATRYYVVFTSSFRGDAAPCISHETESTTSTRTYCGRMVAHAATFEPDNNDLDPDCNVVSPRRAREAETVNHRPGLEAECGDLTTPYASGSDNWHE